MRSDLGLPSRIVISDRDAPRDLAALVVPLTGSVQDTGDVFVPWRLADAAGAVVEPVSAFLAELQASGRSEATLKSYCKALLRWFRFLWVISVPWDQATRAEARVILSPQRTVFHVQQRHLSRCSLPGGHGYLSLHPARR